MGASPVRVEVLGPLRVLVDGAPVEVPGPKRRAVLALLALAEGRTVPVDDLLDALWPDAVPDSGRQALQTHVSRLRGHLGPAAARLRTTEAGYRLDLGPDQLDVAQARELLDGARAAARHDPADAAARLWRAHALWRGPVLPDLAGIGPIATAVQGCARLRQEIVDALVTAATDAGQGERVAGLAAQAHAADPLREPAVLAHMRVLAATGRAPQALDVGREYRRLLAEETGLDPAPALAELERDIAGGAAGPVPDRVAAPVLPTTRLIGRDGEVGAVHRLLATERLVTVVGPGGVGKTRVATEVARGSDAVTVLLLAPVTDQGAIPHALAAALRLTVARGDVLAACAAVLGDRPALLVVDNCEHLLDAVRDTVGALLSACPRLSVLATSREPLGLPAEYAFRLAPLPLPGPDDAGADPAALARVPSVAVFLERAARARPGAAPTREQLRTVADIVRRLDGVPLAIELAAGRLSSFSLAELRARLDRSLDLLGGGRATGDARHRTLRATVEWSYLLLTDEQRRLFRQLSVFADGVDLDTAERLAAELDPGSDPGSALARLVDASMVEADFGAADGTGGTRYRMLETLRAYGNDRLGAEGEQDAAAARLIRWAVELTAWFAAEVLTEREPEADAVLRREPANLREAWRLARGRGALDEAAAMVASLMDAVAYRDLVEFRGWARELAVEFADARLAAHPRAAAVLGVAAEAAYQSGDYAGAERLARAGLALATDETARSYCLLPLSVAALARGAHAEAAGHALEAAGLGPRTSESYGVAALATAYAGDLDRARALNERALATATSPMLCSWTAYVAGEIDNLGGRHELAEAHYREALGLARRSGATFLVGVATVGLLSVLAAAGRTDDALRGYRDVVEYFARTGNWTHLWATLRDLAGLLDGLGDDAAAVLLAAAAAAPDAPADDRGGGAGPTAPAPGRAEALELARRAIGRNLSPT
ncbi:BTAD domain-containing putative transcriptional regulator [Pseudonocardia humida]|uniref:Winged helix-turn-helix domain-containing protein n=1 Tax=Pseudonocardia humida TaxID=2800819 RepID=A0ABT1ABD9_9PSEU|nr:BTAD domain-containing putative transcriptional regulator [Pseudonocardia humida]MCO1660360.1 winged helix-turn-helix domain-containing protein [Pseudonocardia humida]